MRKMMIMLMLALGVSINGFAQSARRGDVTKHMQQAIERVADAPRGTSYGVVEETSDKYVVATPFGRYTLKKEKDGSVSYKGMFIKPESQNGDTYVVGSSFGRFQINTRKFTVKKL